MTSSRLGPAVSEEGNTSSREEIEGSGNAQPPRAGRAVHPLDGARVGRAARWSAAGLAAVGGLALLANRQEGSVQRQSVLVDGAGYGDTADLESAVADADENSIIYVRRSTYTVRRGGLSPAAGVRIVGEGQGTHIRLADGANASVFDLRSPNVTLDSLMIDGNGRRQVYASGNGVQIWEKDCSVVNCYVSDSAGYNIVAVPGCERALILGNVSHDALEEGIELQGASSCVVVGNVVYGCLKNGLTSWNANGDCKFNVLAGNTVKACRGFGIFVYDGAHENAITGNAVLGCGGFGINLENTAVVEGTATPSGYYSSTPDTDPFGNTVTGNSVVGNGADGIRLNAISRVTVGGNVIRGNQGYGIFANESSRCSITANVVSENVRGGILLDGANCAVAHNIASDNGSEHQTGATADLVLGAGAALNALSGNRILGGPRAAVLVESRAEGNISFADLLGSRREPGLQLSGSATGLDRAPQRRVTGDVGRRITRILHGLGYPPRAVSIVPYGPGTVWMSRAADDQNLFLQADRPSVRVEVVVG